MAHIVDDGNEGHVTGAAKAENNLDAWLKKNHLIKLLPYFHSQELPFDELLTITDEEIELRAPFHCRIQQGLSALNVVCFRLRIM